MVITSVNNDKVKVYHKLMNQKKERDKQSRFIVEGEHLVFEAIKEGVAIEIMVLEGSQYDLDCESIIVSKEVMNKICDTKTPQGIIALCQMRPSQLEHFNRILLLDDLQDPGNLGTIIRSCDAFLFDGIIMSPNTVDVYNPKVIRSTQGSIFRVTFLKQDLTTAIKDLQAKGVFVFAADLQGQALGSVKQQEKLAFVMGNESQGVSLSILNSVDDRVTIEMPGSSESLNVAVAASIVMYNFRK